MSITTAPQPTPTLLAEDVDLARRQLVAATRRIDRSGALSVGGWGNASTRLPGHPDHLLLTGPDSLIDLDEHDVAIVSFDGEVVEGSAAEGTLRNVRQHTDVYRRRPDVTSVFHTHSPAATAFAVAERPLPAGYLTLTSFGHEGEVPVTALPRPDLDAFDAIVAAYDAHPGAKALLLARHGVLAVGSSIERAATLALVVEEIARLELAARSLRDDVR